tara:strand:- start:2330 stop:3103 length:774 start_codon:yes stop_codon:yes gene_type:complete
MSNTLDFYGQVAAKSLKVQQEVVFQTSNTNSAKIVVAPQTAAGLYQFNLPDLTASQNILLDSSALAGEKLSVAGMTAITAASLDDSGKFLVEDPMGGEVKSISGTQLKLFIGAGDTLPPAMNNDIMVSNGGDNFVSYGVSGDLTNALGVFTIASGAVDDAKVSATAAIATSKLADGPATAGTASAGDLLQVDSNKDISGLNDVTCESIQSEAVLLGTADWQMVVSGTDLIFQKWVGGAWQTKGYFDGSGGGGGGGGS